VATRGARALLTAVPEPDAPPVVGNDDTPDASGHDRAAESGAHDLPTPAMLEVKIERPTSVLNAHLCGKRTGLRSGSSQEAICRRGSHGAQNGAAAVRAIASGDVH